MKELTTDTWISESVSLPFSILDACRLFYGGDSLTNPGSSFVAVSDALTLLKTADFLGERRCYSG